MAPSAISRFVAATGLAFLLVAGSSLAQETVGDYVKLAEQKAAAGDLKGALALYDAILTQYPKEFVTVYLKRALLRERDMDFVGAIEDYDMILKLDSPDPKEAAFVRPRVYAARAHAKEMVMDFAGAGEDYTAALDADPAISKYDARERLRLHEDRAAARKFSGDTKGAIEDYDAAIAGDPDNSFLLSDRAAEKLALRDYEGAIADYSASIAKAKEPSSITYQERGVARICKGDFAEALADLRKDAALSLSLDGEVYHRPIVHGTHLLIWILRARLEGKSKADAELSAYLATAGRHGEVDQVYDIAMHFLGKTPASALLANAKAMDAGEDGNTAFRSVALCHIGMKLLIDGDAAGAQANFQKVLQLEDTMQYMNLLAYAENERLAAKNASGR